MSTPLISAVQLKQAKRILYMTHLAIGDYMYQGLFLQALKQQYPHLHIDIWIDDCRKKPKAWHAGRNTTLCQWLGEEPGIGHIYPIAASQQQRKEHIQQAREQNYELVFFFATQRSEQFAKYARQIAPDGFIVGSKAKPGSAIFSKWWHFRKLDGYFSIREEQSAQLKHISDVYQQHFHSLLPLETIEQSSARTLKLNIPLALQQQATENIRQLARDFAIEQAYCVFINHLSTTEKRDYQWSQVCHLIGELHQQYPNTVFVLNVPPAELEHYQQKVQQEQKLTQLPVLPFTAREHFYQLPAMINASQLVITVETAIMHIAASLQSQQIALVRKSASQWQPLNASEVLFAGGRVDDIKVPEVLKACQKLIGNHKST